VTLVRCKTCVMPTTRPDTAFVDGECSACISHRNRRAIDWKSRESELLRILETAPKNGSGFDCIVPSSGGKDSTWQVIKLLELGVRPLVVTATTCMLTDVGRKNIDNLARYATTIEVTPNRTVRAKLNKIGLEMVGDISWPEHVSIFTTPFRVAADFGIPLIFYGECPQEAYGGPIGSDQAREMTRRWRSEFGGFLGLRPTDLVGVDGITEADMRDYMLPSEERLANVKAYFLGQFYEWDSHRNAKVAREHGMVQPLPTRANYWRAENVDNAQTGVHDFFGYLKYGYGRLAAQASVDIRSGMVDREGVMEQVMKRDGLYPSEYMGVTLQEIMNHIGMSWKEWTAAVDKFTNHDLFDGKEGGRPILKEFACLPVE
jgi:N-acetyl sugar amidotransferase